MGDCAETSSAGEMSLLANGKSIGERIEELVCYGSVDAVKLSAEDRVRVIEFASSFEECSSTSAELAEMTDAELMRTAYWVMAEYAQGQV